MKNWLGKLAMGILAAWLALTAGGSLAQPLRVNVATFNMGWWVDEPEFSQVLAQCAEPTRNWCDPRRDVQCPALPKRLPPCSAYVQYHRNNGATGRPVLVPTLTYWQARRAALEHTLLTTNADILGLQEISGEAAARAALGKRHADFDYCVSTDPDSQAPEPQRLVIAVRKAFFSILACRSDSDVAIQESADHRLRPALIADLAGPKGTRWRVANVHLKAGCASPAGDHRFDFRGSYLDSTENANCHALRRQLVPLERLIERETLDGAHFIMLGDFNRRLDLEIVKNAGDVRSNGASPVGLPGPQDSVRLMWPEVNDRDPPSSALTLLRRVPRSDACGLNEGLDHIAVSAKLVDTNLDTRSREVDLERFAGGTLAASDHCPLTTQLVAP